MGDYHSSDCLCWKTIRLIPIYCRIIHFKHPNREIHRVLCLGTECELAEMKATCAVGYLSNTNFNLDMFQNLCVS